jgi:hypothetical protein
LAISLKKAFAALLILFINISILTAQEYKVHGKIFDSKSDKPLEFVTVKVADTTYGTTGSNSGEYVLRLKNGEYKIIFSYIGYFTDTSDVLVESGDVEKNNYLRPSEIMTDVIEVLGEDPAYEIIRKAIKYKKQFKEKLNEYNFDAYTKYVIRSNVGSAEDENDTAKQSKEQILALMESETKNYFRKPDEYKTIVKSRRESSNTLQGVAIPYIVNFYDEEVDLGESKILSPLADNALDHYEYKLLGTTSIDSIIVYRIEVIDAGLSPLFKGKIYIADSTYELMKVDLSTNELVNLTAIEVLNFKQKFSVYTDEARNKFSLPTDVQIFAEGSFAGFFKFSGDAFTVISDYGVNKKTPKGVFDEYVIKVLPDARKDSAYWNENQLIKNTDEEKKAYQLIEKESKKEESNFRFNFLTIRYGKYITSYPLSYYHFNRVEGSHLQFNAEYDDHKILNLNGFIGYALQDKKSKYEIAFSNELKKESGVKISVSFFKKLNALFYNLTSIFTGYNTITSLLSKEDYYNYYYASGYDISVYKSFLPQIGLTLNYHQEKQTSAKTNADFSLFKKDQKFRDNPSINHAFQRLAGFSLFLDPNKYKLIDFGDGSESRYTETQYPVLNFGFSYSSKKLKSTYEYRMYSASIEGENNLNNFLNIRYRLGTVILNGEVPFQSLAYFNSTASALNKEFSFRTMDYQEYLGDEIYYFNFENNFKNILWSKIPIIKKFSLIGFFNAGKNKISNSNLLLSSPNSFLITKDVFMEAGFGISGILDFLRVDFAWRLNNRIGGKNFKFSILGAF